MTLNERITAVHIMQRFVRMSRVLLPIYSGLVNKKDLTVSEKRKMKKISTVYESFKANPEASTYLINSDILRLIQNVYYWLVSNKGESPKSFYEYNEFIRESDRLIEVWNKQQMN